MKDSLLDSEGWTMLVECRYHLRDYQGMIDASRMALSGSRANDDRVAYFLHEAYVLQLRDALAVLETGGNHDIVRTLNEVVAFGQAIPPVLDPRAHRINQKIAGMAVVAALHLRDDPQARDFLGGLRDRWQGRPELMERLAMLYHQTGDDSTCADLCAQILLLQPDNATALRLRAQTLSSSSQDRATLAAFRNILNTSDDRPELHRDLGILLFELGDWEQAAQHLQQSYRKDDPDSLNLLIMQAECAFQDGRFERAMDYYRRALRVQPENPDLHRAIGACHWSLGNPSAAEAAFARATQLATHTMNGGDPK